MIKFRIAYFLVGTKMGNWCQIDLTVYMASTHNCQLYLTFIKSKPNLSKWCPIDFSFWVHHFYAFVLCSELIVYSTQ